MKLKYTDFRLTHTKKNLSLSVQDDAESRDPDFEYEEKEVSRYAISNGTPDLCCCYDHKIGRLYVLSSRSMNWMIGPCWP